MRCTFDKRSIKYTREICHIRSTDIASFRLYDKVHNLLYAICSDQGYFKHRLRYDVMLNHLRRTVYSICGKLNNLYDTVTVLIAVVLLLSLSTYYLHYHHFITPVSDSMKHITIDASIIRVPEDDTGTVCRL